MRAALILLAVPTASSFIHSKPSIVTRRTTAIQSAPKEDTTSSAVIPSDRRHPLDLNNDGKVDLQDAQYGMTMTTVAAMVMTMVASPAAAKGGGGGGGGGGHGGRSSTHVYSSMRRGRRRAGYASDPIYYESTRRSTFPAVSPTTPAAASSTSGLEMLNVGRTLAMCSSLPQVGDSFDILREVDPSGIRNGQKHFEPTYDPGTVVESSENGCHYVVQQVNNPSKRLSGDVNTNGENLATSAFVLSAGEQGIISGSIRRRLRNRKFDFDFKQEQEKLRASLAGDGADANDQDYWIVKVKDDEGCAPASPPSGLWKGSTEESDGASQEVSSTLRFLPNGKISGRGDDKDDGAYTIKGAWTPRLIKWTEFYSGGPNGNFKVTVRATVSEKNQLKCDFVSTKNVRGKFKLSFKS